MSNLSLRALQEDVLVDTQAAVPVITAEEAMEKLDELIPLSGAPAHLESVKFFLRYPLLNETQLRTCLQRAISRITLRLETSEEQGERRFARVVAHCGHHNTWVECNEIAHHLCKQLGLSGYRFTQQELSFGAEHLIDTEIKTPEALVLMPVLI